MLYKNIIDQHTHTDNSFDGNHPVKLLCDTAVERGIKAISFTDHLELDTFFTKNFDKTAENAFWDISKAKADYDGKIIVGVGAEFGEAVYEKELSEETMKKYDYDIVIGSIHNLPNKLDFCDMIYSEETDFYGLLDEYFDWELKMAQWAKFDTLAHLTYPLRYMTGEYGKEIDLDRYKDIIDEILLNVIKNKISLEINTSGYRQPYGKPFPHEEILKRYKELGGTMLTFGSDGHYAEHLGLGIDKGYDMALKCGFDKITLYRQREPVLIPIE